MEQTILYFEEPGKQNTEATLDVARMRAKHLGIRQIVVASTHGETARRAAEVFAGLGAKIIGVSINAGFSAEGWAMTDAEREAVEQVGVKMLTSVHTLGDDVNTSFGSSAPNVVVRKTLYTFCQGMKVAIEITLMAADAGLLDMTQEVIAIAGTDYGADTALVLKPAYSRKFTKLHVCEILAKPR